MKHKLFNLQRIVHALISHFENVVVINNTVKSTVEIVEETYDLPKITRSDYTSTGTEKEKAI